MLAGKSRLLVAKGRKLLDLKLAELQPAELERLVIGPSGKLRAPTLLRGRKVMVGYHADGMAEFLGAGGK